MTRELTATVTVDNTDGLRHPAAPSYNRSRTVNLLFMQLPNEEGYLVRAWGSAFPDDGGGGYQGRLLLSPQDLNSSVDVLRRAWQKNVVEYHYQDKMTGRVRFPFADGWDLMSEDQHILAETGPTLARAGYNTFKMLFHRGDKGLSKIRDLLLLALRRGENVLSIESDKLVVPWGMLYTKPFEEMISPAADTWAFDGFWGYRHVIEHTFTRVDDFDSRIRIDTGQVVVGVNVDEQVDQQYPKTPYIQPVIDFFSTRTQVVLRINKDQLSTAFQTGNVPDRISYFGCHGKGAGDGGVAENPYLQLGDGEKIYGAELMAWLTDVPLATRPLVFVGACQGGQVGSAFYTAFGKALLGNGARCLVGPQVDLPPAFACEYSRQLFTAFLEPGAKLGDIVRSLARAFLDNHAKPLGLMFSLYRGIDVHLWQGDT